MGLIALSLLLTAVAFFGMFGVSREHAGLFLGIWLAAAMLVFGLAMWIGVVLGRDE